MSTAFRVHFEPPHHGSLPLSLSTPEEELSFIASFVPYSSLNEFVDCLLSLLLTPHPFLVVRWNTEPLEYHFHFTARDSTAHLEIHQVSPYQTVQDNAHVFSFHASRQSLVRTFWRGLRKLESQWPSEQHWNQPFPTAHLRRLTELLQHESA